MSTSLDELVDSLAQSLQRTVSVDDAELRLLGYSNHFEDPDPARLKALVSRGVTGPAREYILQHRIQTWTAPRRLSASPEHGFAHDRIGFPLRSRYELLGFMWVIDDRRLSDDELQTCLRVADDLARILERRVQSQLASVEEESLVFALVAPDETARAAAARDLRDRGVLSATTNVAALVVQLSGAPTADAADLLRRALSRAILIQARSSAALAVKAERGMVLVASLPSSTRQQSMIAKLADRIISELAKLDSQLSRRARVGIGAPADLSAAEASYEQALTAVRIAERLGQSIVAWEEHPLDGLLDAVLRADVDGRLIPPLLSSVLADQPADTMNIIRCYLDHAGNAADAAKELHLHRTTVYYRLQRFGAATGLDLDDGRVRLMIHLWLAVHDRGLVSQLWHDHSARV